MVKKVKKSYKAIKKHLKSLGLTNRMALYIVLLLFAGMAGSFYLADKSIASGYVGALACWTACFAPMSTAITHVLSKTVDKSKAENTKDGANYLKIEQQFESDIERDC